MNNSSLLQIIKYAVIIIIFVVICKYIGYNTVSDLTIIILAIVFLMLLIITEILIKCFTKKGDCIKNCENSCSVKKEYMENINYEKKVTNAEGDHVDNYGLNAMSENPDGTVNLDYNFNNNLSASRGVKRGKMFGENFSDVKYSDYNHVPLGSHINTGSMDKGYWYLPPSEWYPQPTFPPICATERKCLVQPAYTTGVPMNLKEWDDFARITPPDNINVDYIKNVLNTGAAL